MYSTYYKEGIAKEWLYMYVQCRFAAIVFIVGFLNSVDVAVGIVVDILVTA